MLDEYQKYVNTQCLVFRVCLPTWYTLAVLVIGTDLIHGWIIYQWTEQHELYLAHQLSFEI